jgi:spore coat polysaccharide biosynthesis predicted glycosyltransferase SpsG
VGFEYMVVREEIASLPRQSKGEGVVIVLGGGDVLDQGHTAAAVLARQGQQVTLVQGPLAVNRAPGEGYRVLSDPPDLPALLQGCGWAVTNGGTCMFEALCLGKPAVALPQTPHEAKLAALALAQGALLGVGREALHPWDAAALQAVAPRAAALVDGRGAQRIVAIVKELL